MIGFKVLTSLITMPKLLTSVFKEVIFTPVARVLPARYWRDTGAILAYYCRDNGVISARYWRDTGAILA